MKQESPPTHLDIKAFAHSASTLLGQDFLSNYERLSHEMRAPDVDLILNWSARGEVKVDESGSEQTWVHITADLSMPLTCQRCLGPVDVALAINQSFRFVGSEEAAEAEDEEAEEDVLVLSQDFNLHDLIEDEVLMALPVVPRHETCPVEVQLEVADAGFDSALAEKRNPFAVLAALQKTKPG
jgi:uncharacterized protein